MGRGRRSASSADGPRRSKGERRIASVLAFLPPAREQLVVAIRAKLLHRAVEALLAELDRFVDRYETWAKRVGLLS
jgi:hypothetical protein